MSATERIKLLLAYDGRPFRGWQSQATADAVQDHLEAALLQLTGDRIVVHGSGRTDAGVHALGQVAHIDVPRGKMPPETWRLSLNACLPQEIRVVRSSRARAKFHARFDASGKTYLYRIWNAPFMRPLELGRAWFVPRPLDPAKLREAAALFCGRHDFASFAANRRQPEPDTVRTIHRLQFAQSGPLITLRFTGDGFLYRMVRLLTGAIIRCAEGRMPLERVRELLASSGGVRNTFSSPAEGLYLARVLYGENTRVRSATPTRSVESPSAPLLPPPHSDAP